MEEDKSKLTDPPSLCSHASVFVAERKHVALKLERDLRGKGCQLCSEASSVWVCLADDCSFVGCKENEHLLVHAKDQGSHHLFFCLGGDLIWCIRCDQEGALSSTHQLAAPTLMTTKKKKKPKQKGAGVRGLSNLGNTCYMNGALQCLSNTEPLRWYFRKEAKSLSSKAESTHSISYLFSAFMKAMWDGSRSHYSPRQLVHKVRQSNPMFADYGQQDTQEFLRCLLDLLHENLKEECAPPPQLANTAQKGKGEKDSKEEKEPEKLLEKEQDESISSKEKQQTDTQKPSTPTKRYFNSIINDIFEGLLQSTVECLQCHKPSITKDPFWDLSVSIPTPDIIQQFRREDNEIVEEPGWASRLLTFIGLWSPTVSLGDCLRAFCMEEKLTRREQYKCENCKKMVDCVKSFNIIRPPEVLCIHIKRFRQDGWMWSKETNTVEFPTEDLDIRSYCKPHEIYESELDNTRYSLIGLIQHSGGISGGHYVAYARNSVDGNWYEFNDEYATQVSVETVKGLEAYVLFYQREIPEEKVREREEGIAKIREFRNGNGEKGVYICKRWYQRWRVANYPGPIQHERYICEHNKLKPGTKKTNLKLIPLSLWTDFTKRYGGGIEIPRLVQQCAKCLEKREQEREREREKVEARQRSRRSSVSSNKDKHF